VGYRLGSTTAKVNTSFGRSWNTNINKLGLYPTTTTKFVATCDVICQYQNMSFGVTSGTLHVSTDSSVTFPTTVSFTDANLVRAGHIFANGNIMFTTRDNKIYLTNTDLDTPVEKTIYEADGVTPYVIHTPSNATYPGWYFEILTYQERNVNENLHVFGNYCNAYDNGAAPVNIYYSNDNGETYKIAYEFGQNLNYRDNGTATGSDTTGTLLGDSGNANVSRHMHSIGYDTVNDKWYAVVGDHNEPDTKSQVADEIGWYEGAYTVETDIWVWTRIDFGFSIETTNHLKAIQPIFHDGYVYWGSDVQTVTDSTQNGLWRSPIATITDVATHRQIFAIEELYASSIVDFRIDRDSGVVIGSINDPWSPAVKRRRLFTISNYGLGKLSLYTDASGDFMRISDKNSDGYYMFDYEGRDTLQTKTFFIRIGSDFLDNL